MNKINRYYKLMCHPAQEDWHKRKVLIEVLILSMLVLLVTSLSFYVIDFKIAAYMGLFGVLGTIHIAANLYVRKRLIESVNLLAVYANIVFLVEILFSGGITSPAIYWLMISPFFLLIFSDYEMNKSSIMWIIISFSEFVILYILNELEIGFSIGYPIEWFEELQVVFVITFMCFCATVMLLDVKRRKEAGLSDYAPNVLIKNNDENTSHDEIAEVSKTANKLHRRLVWIAVILIPIFPDYLFFEETWKSVFAIRVGLVLYFIMANYANAVGKLSARALAYMCLIPIVIFLSFATSQVPLENALIYNINYSAVFIISAIFLLWEWKNSLIVVLISLFSYLTFSIIYGRLDFHCFVEDGAWLLFSIGFASIWLIRFRYKYSLKEVSFRKDLEKSNRKLSYHNNELKLLNKKLLRSEEKLKQSSLVKDKFFSIISHDLRSPIGTVSSFIRILNDDSIELSREKEREILDRLEESLNNVEILIDNLLNWAKSQMGTLKVNHRYFEINEVINRCLRLFKEDLERKNIAIEFKQKNDFSVFGDVRIAEFVVRNILANAIKFSYEGRSIAVQYSKDENYLFVSIIDSGTGMSDEDIKKLLDTSTHFTKPGTNREMGTGLGMQLCLDFIRKNKGELKIESQIGVGSKFTFSIPLFRSGKASIEVSESMLNINYN